MHSMYRRGKTVAVVNIILTKLVKPDEYFACNNEHINMYSSWQDSCLISQNVDGWTTFSVLYISVIHALQHAW